MKQARIITKQEFQRLLSVVASNKHAERNRAVVFLSFYAGLRACEIASLRIHDVVADDGTIKAQVILESYMTKGDERQQVILNRVLRKELAKYVKSVCSNYSRNDALIKSQKGSAFSPLTITQLFAKLYKLSGISGASSHSGRRFFIDCLASKSVNVRVIQALARHKHLNTTMLYIDITQSKLDKAVEAVEL